MVLASCGLLEEHLALPGCENESGRQADTSAFSVTTSATMFAVSRLMYRLLSLSTLNRMGLPGSHHCIYTAVSREAPFFTSVQWFAGIEITSWHHSGQKRLFCTRELYERSPTSRSTPHWIQVVKGNPSFPEVIFPTAWAARSSFSYISSVLCHQ